MVATAPTSPPPSPRSARRSPPATAAYSSTGRSWPSTGTGFRRSAAYSDGGRRTAARPPNCCGKCRPGSTSSTPSKDPRRRLRAQNSGSGQLDGHRPPGRARRLRRTRARGHRLQAPRFRLHAWAAVTELDQDVSRAKKSFVIGGWLPGRGVNHNNVDALILGARGPDGGMCFCGVVGAGINTAERRRLIAALTPIRCATAPFAAVPGEVASSARWVHPTLVGDVEYREFLGSLRHPAWKGLRSDLTSDHVEQLVQAWPVIECTPTNFHQ